MEKQSLLIIGAGISGLMAAYGLADDFDITILEAQPRIGGRIHTISGDGQYIEAGAEFVHGDLPLTGAILKEAGIETEPIEGKMYRHRNGQLAEQEDMIEGWDGLLKAMKHYKGDTTLSAFLEDQYAGDDPLKKEALAYAEGFDLADPAQASMKALYKEWDKDEMDNYRVNGGYSALVDWLEKELYKKGVRIHIGKCVKQVDWEVNDITVTTSEEEKFDAQKLLVTIPVSMLGKVAAAGSINFTPEIDGYQKAAADIGFGAIVKVVLSFKKPCWPADMGFIFSEQAFRTWWSQLPSQAPTITGWCGGPKALAMRDKSDDEILHIALNSLSTILKMTVAELEELLTETYVFNWPANPLIEGGYSYEILASASAKEILNTPITNTIFFAGEGLYSGDHPGTVEAAMATAKLAVKQIQK